MDRTLSLLIVLSITIYTKIRTNRAKRQYSNKVKHLYDWFKEFHPELCVPPDNVELELNLVATTWEGSEALKNIYAHISKKRNRDGSYKDPVHNNLLSMLVDIKVRLKIILNHMAPVVDWKNCRSHSTFQQTGTIWSRQQNMRNRFIKARKVVDFIVSQSETSAANIVLSSSEAKIQYLQDAYTNIFAEWYGDALSMIFLIGGRCLQWVTSPFMS